MARYIMLTNWTDQGIRNVKESPKRLDTARSLAKSVGAEIKDFYMTMGDHDMVIIYEAPDDAVAARFTLMNGRLGFIRTETMKAFPEQAYREIINSLG